MIKKNLRMRTRFILVALILTLMPQSLLGCIPVNTPVPEIEASPSPSQTASPTATIVWFPPTATPTPFPTSIIAPTEEYRPGIGEIILEDDFSSSETWTTGQSASANVAFGKNELTIAVSQPEGYGTSVRQEPVLSDFYLEITASPTLCQGSDEYGLLLRVNSTADFYRFSLSCDGRARLDKLLGGVASSPQPWMESGVIPTGAPSISRLATWVHGSEMRFFVDDFFLFSVKDPMLPTGLIGVFARSREETAVTVNFSDLVIWEIAQ